MKGQGKRVQEGTFHVYSRGSFTNTIFYDDHDYIKFLESINVAAKTYNSSIKEFAIMNNHFHLQITTRNLTKLMQLGQRNFTRWYKTKYQISDRIFQSPFQSSPLYSTKNIYENSLYILKNPVACGAVNKPEDYKWSSYNFHFRDNCILKRYIDMDTSFVDSFCKSRRGLESELYHFKMPTTNLIYNNESCCQKVSTNDLTKIIKDWGGGRTLYELERV